MSEPRRHRALRPGGLGAVIFDMDGLLIDSEPLWHEAEMAVLVPLSVPLTPSRCLETTGMRVDEMVAHWFDRYPWPLPALNQVAGEVVAEVSRRLRQRAEPMPGARTLVESLAGQSMPLAIASSSPRSLIDATLDGLAMTEAFVVRCSAMDELRGKPDPAVFLSAARALGKSPAECLVLEDSLAGVDAALAAGMTVLAVPANAQWDQPGFDAAHGKLRSLADIDLGCIQELTMSKRPTWI